MKFILAVLAVRFVAELFSPKIKNAAILNGGVQQQQMFVTRLNFTALKRCAEGGQSVPVQMRRDTFQKVL